MFRNQIKLFISANLHTHLDQTSVIATPRMGQFTLLHANKHLVDTAVVNRYSRKIDCIVNAKSGLNSNNN